MDHILLCLSVLIFSVGWVNMFTSQNKKIFFSSIILLSFCIMSVISLHCFQSYTYKEETYISSFVNINDKKLNFNKPMKITVRKYKKPYCIMTKEDEYFIEFYKEK